MGCAGRKREAPSNFVYRRRDFVSTQVASQPTLMIDADPRQPGIGCVAVHNLDPDLTASLGIYCQAGRLLESLLRVSVVESGGPGDEDLPDVFGRYQVLGDGIRFIPHFPFESGIQYRASFDPRPLARPELSEALTLEFSFPKEMSAAPAHVQHVFPSSNSLPENLLRFYICFSNSMQRGRAEQHIRLLGPDGRPVPDTLYRPPVELWDRSMRHLTILLDPGRLKRGVGPNRELGPPLKPGLEYALAVGPLREAFYKSFRVTEVPPDADLETLAATIKARWVCEQAHQQLKEELGLDHFEGRSWRGLHRHALMTMIAYAFLQHLRLAAASGGKKNLARPASADDAGHTKSRRRRPGARSALPMPALPPANRQGARIILPE